ncbi:alpha/beta hydrolase [Nocardia sp. NPDC004860]|uniref:alpha/beta hydrolase n=1 Tax=Nocardia sp. NPDC004860 TaxID=3154557 RepID=UPI0033BE2D99
MTRKDLSFTSHGITCAAWHIPATSTAFERRSGRPCVVLAHGFGGTRDTGLLPYAESFAAAGLDAFVFDYRGFGDSEGTPRQLISYRRQRQDYHAAIDAARRLPGVDPDRIALWGTSYSAGHAIAVAAQSRRIAAVVSLTPATDGLAGLALIARKDGVGRLARLAARGLADAATVITGGRPRMVPIVGQPGSTAMITVTGAKEAYTSFAGPTWRNEIGARHALEVARNRPTIYAEQVTCPVLVQIGEADRVVPVAAAHRMARKLGDHAVVKEYPVDHFDVYDGVWQRRALADQLEFFGRVLR